MTDIPDLKERLELERDGFHMPDSAFEDLRRRRVRRQTRRRVSAGLVAFAAVAGASLLVGTVFLGATRSPVNRPTPPIAGGAIFGPRVPVPYLNGVKDMVFVDATHGWLVEARWVLATVDGGRTWQRQAELPKTWPDLTQIEFVDRLHGWALAPAGIMGRIGDDRRELLRTVDGGLHWTPTAAPAPPGVSLVQVDFITPSLGWGRAVADLIGTSVYRTTDGGASWQYVRASLSGGGSNANSMLASIGSICFASPSEGWAATGADFAAGWTLRHGPQNFPSVLRTTDGGTTWRVSYTFVPSGHVQETFVDSEVKCALNGAYALFKEDVESSEAYAVVRTTDGGASWAPILTQGRFAPSSWPELPWLFYPSGGVPGPFFAFDANNATFLSVCPQCGGGTTGVTWTREAGRGFRDAVIPHSRPPIVAASFSDRLDGWIVLAAPGELEHVIATTDGGASWRQVFPSP